MLTLSYSIEGGVLTSRMLGLKLLKFLPIWYVYQLPFQFCCQTLLASRFAPKGGAIRARAPQHSFSVFVFVLLLVNLSDKIGTGLAQIFCGKFEIKKQEDDSCIFVFWLVFYLILTTCFWSFHIAFKYYLICLITFCQEGDNKSSPVGSRKGFWKVKTLGDSRAFFVRKRWVLAARTQPWNKGDPVVSVGVIAWLEATPSCDWRM